ncbi:MAG: Ldh family oxidoreductase [Chloroflexi bacterium]|nr:Ldh family oxidoreductase [Chloroflexota bacterium]
MPVVTGDLLHKLAEHLLLAAGASPEESRTVADHMVGANLAGHDSHGIILLPTYLRRIKVGHIRPRLPFKLVRESPATAVIDGQWGFGQVVSTHAMRLAIEKARAHNIAGVTVFHQSHVGRLADYPMMATREGMIGFMTCDSGRSPKLVAPFGGRGRRLGTNPLCFAFPSDLPGPVFIDMATSAVAGGKLTVHQARGQPVPPGWIVDREGNPTTNPADYFAGGAILPVGGDQGHKGYGLSFAVETFSGILTGLGFGHDPQGPHNDGSFLAAIKVDAFRPLHEFKRELGEFIAYLKNSPPAAGFQEVLYPGELEYRTEQERRRDGIFVEDETWAELRRLAQEHGLEATLTLP